MRAIILFTKQEIQEFLKKLELNHNITLDMLIEKIELSSEIPKENVIRFFTRNPKNCPLWLYAQIIDILFDAEKNPEIYYREPILSEEESRETDEEENFIDSIIAGLPNIYDEVTETEVQKEVSQTENIPESEIYDPLPLKWVREPENFKFFKWAFGINGIKTFSSPSISRDTEPIIDIINTDHSTPPPPPDNCQKNIHKPLKIIWKKEGFTLDDDIQRARDFAKALHLLDTKIRNRKKSKYSLPMIREEYNRFVKVMEHKLQSSFSQYYITESVRDDETLTFHYPDIIGTKKIIDSFAGMLITRQIQNL